MVNIFLTPETSPGSLVVNNFPSPADHYFDICHYRLVLPILKLHVNGPVWYILVERTSFAERRIWEIPHVVAKSSIFFIAV